MYKRLTYEAEQFLLTGAREVAIRFSSPHIEVEHLLLGLLERFGCKDFFDNVKSHSKLMSTLKTFLEERGVKEELKDRPFSEKYQEYLSNLSIKLSALENNKKGDPYFLFQQAISFSPFTKELLEKGKISIEKYNNIQNLHFETLKQREENAKNNQFLSNFTKNMVEVARQGGCDPIIGREKELERTIKILSRRRKNNPILLGEPGVGKTALVELLSQRIASKDVPDFLQDKEILHLDMASVVAGTKYRGEFEERLKKLLQIVMERRNVILFIDEIHTIVGAGGSEGAIDAANILKPPLSRGDLQCIGATTVKEYRKRIEKDSALERRFQNVYIEEPNEEATKEILYGIMDYYGTHHHVVYTKEAIETAVKASQRYLTERFQPDKAIDLLDEAGAEKRIAQSEKPHSILKLEEKLRLRNLKKEQLVSQQAYEEAIKERDRIARLQSDLTVATQQWQRERGEAKVLVEAEDVLRVVSTATGIPVERLAESEAQRLLRLEDELNAIVVGQEKAVGAIASAIRRSRVGFSSPQRPLGSFLFLGPTGVGKTYLAKTLAENLFGSSDALIRIDMSDYMEKHNVSKLVGAPPGYVGFEEGGMLSGLVRRRPYCVVLLDEIEKAHPDVFHLLLQVLEEGELVDSLGHKVSFRNAIIIMTSNLGSKDLSRTAQLGFSQEKGWKSYAEIKQSALSEAKRFLSPEFINRLDEIIVFDALKEPQIRKIVDILCQETIDRLAQNGLQLKIPSPVRDHLVNIGYDPIYGARTMRRVLRSQIEEPLALQCLINGKAKKIECKMSKGEVSFHFSSEEVVQEESHEL